MPGTKMAAQFPTRTPRDWMSSPAVSTAPDPAGRSPSTLPTAPGGWTWCPILQVGNLEVAKPEVTWPVTWWRLESGPMCPELGRPLTAPSPALGGSLLCHVARKLWFGEGECVVRRHAGTMTPLGAAQASPSANTGSLGGFCFFFLRQETGESLSRRPLYFLYSSFCSIFNFLF